MSLSNDPTLRTLNECGCCEGLTSQAPDEVYNRFGLPAIAYRIGTHTSFREMLVARLSASDMPSLRQLRTRDKDDFTIALLDAWAVVADILTFYQERIANESYLRTATETTSLYAMARLIGYKPRPGVAASTYLAFVLEAAADIDSVPVPSGTRTMSVPGPGEKPQTFETIEDIIARPEWNEMRPRLTIPQPVTAGMQSVIIRGVANDIRAGDPVLIVAGTTASDQQKKLVVRVTKDSQRQTTRLDLQEQPVLPSLVFMLFPFAAFASQPLKLTASVVADNVIHATWSHADLAAQARVQRWPVRSLVRNIAAQRLIRTAAARTGVYPLERAQVFGHNAPAFATINGKISVSESNWDKPSRMLNEGDGAFGYIDLDAVYRSAVKDAYVVLQRADNQSSVHRILSVSERSLAMFTLSGKATRIQVDNSSALANYGMRETTVWLARSDPFDLADLPVTDDLPEPGSNNTIILDLPYLNLAVGQNVMVTGERADLEGVVESELATIAGVEISGGDTRLTFKQALKNTYKRGATTINANVALATHGEKTTEVLGSGDAGVPFQTFKLRQPPLTYVAAQNSTGASSTMEIRVGGLLYKEVAQLFGSGPDDRVYSLRQTSEGDTWVQFGDGITGARLPTGLENVTATYRKGMGEEALVKAGQLTLLVTKPLGVRSVSNPMAASGAVGPEQLEDVRTNAALPLVSLERIVSLRDYESFARSFSGVTKALATWTWDGRRSGVFLTVAGSKRSPEIARSSNTYKSLLPAIASAATGRLPVTVESYRPAYFRIEGKVKSDPAYDKDKVLAAVAAALELAFDFDHRSFGQPVTLSEAAAVMHAVPGVLAVDIDYLYRVGEGRKWNSIVTADLPKPGVAAPLAAELLLLDPRAVPLVEMP